MQFRQSPVCLRRLSASVLVGFLAAAFNPLEAHATTIRFDVQNVGGNRWEYGYAITNDTLSQPIQEFSIFFDENLTSNLSVASSVSGWDLIVVQPDPQLPDDGFFDALATGGGLAQFSTVVGFRVGFDYLGPGTPGAQQFTLVDPQTFGVLGSGTTQPVPAPGAILLFVTALGSLLVRRRGQPH